MSHPSHDSLRSPSTAWSVSRPASLYRDGVVVSLPTHVTPRRTWPIATLDYGKPASPLSPPCRSPCLTFSRSWSRRVSGASPSRPLRSVLPWRATIRSEVLTSPLSFSILYFYLPFDVHIIFSRIRRAYNAFSRSRVILEFPSLLTGAACGRTPSPSLFARSYSGVRVSSLLSVEAFRTSLFVFLLDRLAFSPLFIPLSLFLSLPISFTLVFTPGKTDDRFSCMNGVQRDAIVRSFSVDPRVGESQSERGRRLERDGGRT